MKGDYYQGSHAAESADKPARAEKPLLDTLIADFTTCNALLSSFEDRLEAFSARLSGGANTTATEAEASGTTSTPQGSVAMLAFMERGFRHRAERLLKLMSRLEGIA